MSDSMLPPLPGQRKFGAVCLGVATCDYLCLVPGYPVRGEKTYIKQMSVGGGGQAATAACALCRLGQKAAFAGVCGDDEAGEKIVKWFREDGVDVSGLVQRPGGDSLQSFIMVEEPDAERTIVCHHGSNYQLRPEEVLPGLIASAQVLHLDGHYMAASLEAARMAKRHGVLVSMDGERIFPQTEELLSLCDVAVACHDFPQRLTGIEDPHEALRAMARKGPAWVGRTMGAGGCELLAGGKFYYQPAYPVKALDTTGAGDVFHGGLVYAILTGQPPQEALATASALAALSVTGLGGRQNLPNKAGLEAFMRASGQAG